MSDQNILDFFVDRNFKKLNFGYIQDIDMAIGHEILGTWSAMNGGGSNIKDSMFESLKNWNETESLDKADINQILPLFNQPKIHGNSQKEYVLIPLCIFRRNPMEPCSLFETSSSSIGQTKCYTFNSNPNKDMKGGKVGPDNGLRFMTKVRIPSSYHTDLSTVKSINPLKLVLHEPGTRPDIHFRSNTFIEIKPGKQYIIGTEATILEVTKSFEKLHDYQRNCTLNSDPQINCYFRTLIQDGIQKCHCIPWYMNNQFNETQICLQKEFICFENSMKNLQLQLEILKKCLPTCSYIKYKSNVIKEEELDKNSLAYEEVQADVVGSILEGFDGNYWSYIQINFADPHATVINQDAKVTFADKIGSIGGTFGVFLGLSFVSLLDEILDGLQNIYRLLNKNKSLN